MRLLLVTQDFPPDVGGIQTYAIEIARHLAPRCADFAVVAPARPGAASVDAALPFEVIRIETSYDLMFLKAIGPVWRLARQRGFDTALHVQWSTALASMVARLAGSSPRRVFIAAHGREILFEPLAPGLQFVYDRFRDFVLRRADGLFPVSRYTAGLLRQRGASAERITVVHNGTDPDFFHPMDARPLRRELGAEGGKVLLSVGRLVGRKGIDTVLRALPEVVRAVPAVAYLVAGDGPDRPRLEALARSLCVSSRVQFLGTLGTEALRQHYNACDVFVLPAREASPDVEGFGIVFLEAGACGKPVVGARAGGVPDAIRHGETGYLVEPDDEAALAEALITLLRDEDLAHRLGEQGRRRVVREATWKHAADRLYSALTA